MDNFSACIDTDFDPFNAISKKKMLGKDLGKSNGDCATGKKKVGKDDLIVSKGSRDYYSKKLKEYFDKTLEFVDVVDKQEEITEKKPKEGIKLIKTSKYFASNKPKKSKKKLDDGKVKKKRKHKSMTHYMQTIKKKKNNFDESKVDFGSFCVGMNDLFSSK